MTQLFPKSLGRGHFTVSQKLQQLCGIGALQKRHQNAGTGAVAPPIGSRSSFTAGAGRYWVLSHVWERHFTASCFLFCLGFINFQSKMLIPRAGLTQF